MRLQGLWQREVEPWREYSRGRGRPPRIWLLVDKGDLHAQIGSQEGGRIASRATPDDGQLRGLWWHACSALQGEQKGLLQRLDHPAEKAHAISTINEAMVIRQGQG